MYLSCPNCRKKVIQPEDASCLNCNQSYSLAKYRYLLKVELVDAYDSVWASCYDEIAEKIMISSAD